MQRGAGLDRRVRRDRAAAAPPATPTLGHVHPISTSASLTVSWSCRVSVALALREPSTPLAKSLRYGESTREYRMQDVSWDDEIKQGGQKRAQASNSLRTVWWEARQSAVPRVRLA